MCQLSGEFANHEVVHTRGRRKKKLQPSHNKTQKANQPQAEGRDSAEAQIQTSNKPREVQVPYYDDQGMLQYSLMEFVPEDQSGPYWTVRQKVTASTNPQQQPQLYRMAATTSDQPRAPIYASATVLQGHA